MTENEDTKLKDSFFSLTPERILRSVEKLGLRCTGRVLQLNSMENRVYEVEVEVDDDDLPMRAPERSRIVKFYRPGRWSHEQILEEHRFLLDLSSNDVAVVRPLEFPSGETLLKVDDLGIYCATFERALGRSPDELFDDQLQRLGRLLARVHMIGAQKEAPNRIELTPAVYGLQNLELLLQTGLCPEAIEPYYKQMVESICSMCAPWFERFPQQRIHGDCHIGNVLWGHEGPFLVDFDDMVRGPVAQDLWLLAGGRDPEGQRRLELILEGYQELRQFDREQLVLIEALRALRMIHFTAWIAKRWDDPYFKRTFTHFGSDEYWREQLSDLQEQLVVMQGGEI